MTNLNAAETNRTIWMIIHCFKTVEHPSYGLKSHMKSLRFGFVKHVNKTCLLILPGIDWMTDHLLLIDDVSLF